MPKSKPAVSGHNIDAKTIISRLCTLLDEQDGLAEDISELKKEAKAGGLDMKALGIAVKQIRKPLDEELKATVNSYIEDSGQMALFV